MPAPSPAVPPIAPAAGAAPLTTFTLFGFPPSVAVRAWAFTEMGIAPRALGRVPGLRFFQLVGSGHGQGFSRRPDFGRYGLLAVWESAAAADDFFATSAVVAAYRRRVREEWTVRLAPTAAHGAWGGTNPFLPVAAAGAPGDAGAGDGGPVAVLTRATVRLRSLASFWRAVPSTSEAIARAPGLLASIGIGEVPYLRQATFSLWRSAAAMRAFAYADPVHREVIRRTRAEGWYEEELFARFRPLGSSGTWNGRDPLASVVLPGSG